MQRRSFIRNSALTFGALTLSQQRVLAALFQEPWKITMLRGNVGIFNERGGTIAFLLTPDGHAVIDSQFPDTAKHLIDGLKQRTDTSLRYLINTHHHGDHTGGNIAFKGLVKQVVAHQNSLANQQRAAQTARTEDKQLYPDTTYTDKWKAKLGKEKINLRYFGAGHTNGDSLVHFEKANIVHLGDLLFNRRHPFVDRTAGANMQSWTTVLERAHKTFEKDTLFVFGHAAEGADVTGSREDLLLFRDYLLRVLDFARQQVKAGTTRDVFLKYTEIPGETRWKGAGIERPLAAAWDEVAGG